MKKLIIALLLLATPVVAEDHVTIAIRTNQFDTPAMARMFIKLGEHVPAKHLSDSFHGIKTKGHIMGGQWVTYTNTLGHVWMVNNFRRSELETTRLVNQYGPEYTGPDGQPTRDLTNTVVHGRTVDAARLDDVRNGAPQSALKMSINQDPGAQLASWGLFAIKEDTE